MSSTIPKNYLASISVEQTIIAPISTLSGTYFAYGIYVLLFGTYLHMIRSRNPIVSERRSSNLYIILAVILFMLSTIFMVNYTIYAGHASVVRFTVVKNEDYELFERYQNQDDFERRFGFLTGAYLAAFLNIAAEWMLIHRCYVIWGSSKIVAVPLIVGSVLVNACGLTGIILKSIGICTLAERLMVVGNFVGFGYNIASAVFNLIITLLTAGRIWWIHRQVRAQGTYTSDRLAQSISRFILESGMIYPIMSGLALITTNTIPADKYTFDPFPLAALSAGIAPTLIMVRAKLGQNVESLQEAVSDMRFTSQPARQGFGGISTTRSQVQAVSVVGNAGYFESGDGRVGDVKETSVIV